MFPGLLDLLYYDLGSEFLQLTSTKCQCLEWGMLGFGQDFAVYGSLIPKEGKFSFARDIGPSQLYWLKIGKYFSGWLCVYRILDCQVYAVGKPVFHNFTDELYGAWMRDPMPKNDQEKFWMTRESENIYLYEYANKTAFRDGVLTKQYRLEFPFSVSNQDICAMCCERMK